MRESILKAENQPRLKRVQRLDSIAHVQRCKKWQSESKNVSKDSFMESAVFGREWAVILEESVARE